MVDSDWLTDITCDIPAETLKAARAIFFLPCTRSPVNVFLVEEIDNGGFQNEFGVIFLGYIVEMYFSMRDERVDVEGATVNRNVNVRILFAPLW